MNLLRNRASDGATKTAFSVCRLPLHMTPKWDLPSFVNKQNNSMRFHQITLTGDVWLEQPIRMYPTPMAFAHETESLRCCFWPFTSCSSLSLSGFFIISSINCSAIVRLLSQGKAQTSYNHERPTATQSLLRSFSFFSTSMYFRYNLQATPR